MLTKIIAFYRKYGLFDTLEAIMNMTHKRWEYKDNFDEIYGLKTQEPIHLADIGFTDNNYHGYKGTNYSYFNKLLKKVSF